MRDPRFPERPLGVLLVNRRLEMAAPGFEPATPVTSEKVTSTCCEILHPLGFKLENARSFSGHGFQNAKCATRGFMYSFMTTFSAQVLVYATEPT